jgi:hypothetical protein
VSVTQLDIGAVRNVVTDSSGRWIVSNLPSGRVRIAVSAPGFKQLDSETNYDGSRPAPIVSTLNIGGAAETVTVMSSNSAIDYQALQRDARKAAQKAAEKQQTAASANVTKLQERISGVLPVRVDVPRAGNSYHFVRPLVLDEETKMSFTYKSR